MPCKETLKNKTQVFIDKANIKHNYLFSYSETEYINSGTKVIISCSKHGNFEQIPESHLAGNGCPKCGQEKRTFKSTLTYESFIKRAYEIHQDKYSYYEDTYTKSSAYIKIHCNTCGKEWNQKACNHLRGSGCPYCIGRGKTTEEFVKELTALIGDKYDLSKVEYITDRKKVEIVCREHGSFFTNPNRLLQKSGCPKCCGMYKSREDVLDQIKEKIGDKYDYSKFIFDKMDSKSEIICHKHGSFFIRVNDLLRNHGCPSCKGELLKELKTYDIETFIEKSVSVHNHQYDYSEVIYIDASIPVKIRCTKCNHFFYQKPAKHLQGRGCIYCRISKGEIRIFNFLDECNIQHIREFRIKGCKFKKPLPFDFAIFEDQEKTKLKMLIEYDGEHHFKPILRSRKDSLKKAEERLQEIKFRDQVKTQYCLDNSIPLLRIPYWDFDKIETILASYIP